MRKIYLHIGCGKTGSSALQLWLNKNAGWLKQKGIEYPVFEESIDNDYKITNGNGPHAVAAIRKGYGDQYFKSLLKSCAGNILLSSENFQMLEKQEVLELSRIFERLKVVPIVIAYVRDLYDILNSGYHQLIKRHLFYESFDSYIYSLESIQQFDVLNRWSSYFSEVMVLHYNSEQTNLACSFLKALGVDASNFPPMNKKTVNRSLSFIEVEILKLMNRLFAEKYESPTVYGFSTAISDMFIYRRPEDKSHIFYDKELENFLLEKFGKQILEVNQRYFNGQDVLRVFRSEGKVITNQPYSLPNEFAETIEILMTMVESFNIQDNICKSLPKESTPLNIRDPRIVNALREEAFRRESSDLISSLELMTAAKVLRPQGPVINQKIIEYKTRLKGT